MEQSFGVEVRVNGGPISQVRLRGPHGDRQLVIVDPAMGAFAVDDRDDRFHIEVRERDTPAAATRAKLPNEGWRHISAQALIEMLSPEDANTDSDGDGDRCSWVHGSDVAEIRAFTSAALPSAVRARMAFNKAARTLYAAEIPYFLVGVFRPPKDDAGRCENAALLLVPDAKQAHQCLCASEFEPHPTWHHSVVHRRYGFEVRLVPSKPESTGLESTSM